MKVRGWTGATMGAFLLGFGLFLVIDEFRGKEPPRIWFPVVAVAPGLIILTATWLIRARR